MNLRKIWLIARREYWVNIRRRSFLAMMFGMPIFMAVAMGLTFALSSSAIDETGQYKAVGVVDLAGVLAKADGTPAVGYEKPFLPMRTEAEADQALRDRQIDGYYVIPATFMTKGQVDVYYRQSLALNDGLRKELNALIKKGLSARFPDPNVAARLENPMEEMKIYRIGIEEDLPESAMIASFLVPTFVASFLFIMVMTSSQFLMSGLVEEKENRMMEVFMTSARPAEMLWGKMLGMGALGFTQVAVWAVFAVVAAIATGNLGNLGKILLVVQITPSFSVLLLVYTFLGYLINGALMAGVGATVNAETESRQWGSILSLFGTIPFILFIVFIMEPNGTAARVMSFIPVTAPIAMILRLSVATVPTIDIVISIAILLVSVTLVIYVSARIFRMGMLNYGKGGVLRVIRQAVFGRRSAPMPAYVTEQQG